MQIANWLRSLQSSLVGNRGRHGRSRHLVLANTSSMGSTLSQRVHRRKWQSDSHLGIEALEVRTLLSGTGLSDEAQPYVLDVNAGANRIVLRAANAVPGEISFEVDGISTAQLPLDTISNLVVTGGDGDDTLIVDFSYGNPIPAGGLVFYGGNNTANGPGDAIELTGGFANETTYQFDNASDGTISIDSSLITYVGLEPIVDNLSVNVRNFRFLSSVSTGTLSRSPLDGNLTRINTNVSELVDFTAPNHSLQIQLANGTNNFAISSVGDLYATPLNRIWGGTGNDAITWSSYATTAPWWVRGGAGTDTIRVDGSLGPASTITLEDAYLTYENGVGGTFRINDAEVEAFVLNGSNNATTADHFDIRPRVTQTVSVAGGEPSALPADELNFIGFGGNTTGTFGSGTFTQSGYANVDYSELELVSRTVPPTRWIPQGPAPNTLGQTENVSPNNEVSGAVQVVVAHPTDSNVLYVAAVNGGVWRTMNATATSPDWEPLTDQYSSLSVHSLVMHPQNPSILLAGLGSNSSYGGAGGSFDGILLSEDAGDTWTLIGSASLTNREISGIGITGSGATATIVAAVHPFSPTGAGVYRSTDGGATFSLISGTNGLASGGAFDLVQDPIDNNRMYASVKGQGIYRTDDAGASWTNITSSNSTVNTAITSASNNNAEMAISPVDQRLYTMINLNGQANYIGWYNSSNGSWTAMDLPQTPDAGGGANEGLNPREKPGGQGAIHSSIVADPTNANIVYVGGDRQDTPFTNYIGANNFSGRLFRGNASVTATGAVPSPQWAHLTHSNAVSGIPTGGTASGSSPHADSREMVFDAAGNLIEGDDGGIYRRTSPRANTGDWFSINGDLQITELHDVGYDPVANIIMGGAQDTGTPEQTIAGGLTHRSVSTADGGDVAVAVLSATQSLRYSSFQLLGGFRRRLVDQNNTVVSTTFPSLTVSSGATPTWQFVQPIITNPYDGNRLLLPASNSVYESTNQGQNISEIGAGITVTGGSGNPVVYGGKTGGTANPDLIYAAEGSALFVRTSVAGGFTSATSPGVTIRDLVADHDDYNTVFALGSSTVYRSTNTGGSWTNITGNLGSFGAGTFRAIQYFPDARGDFLVVGTNRGMYYSLESDFTQWFRLSDNFPNVPVYDLDFSTSDNLLVAGTLGRGAWALTAAAEVVHPVARTQSSSGNASDNTIIVRLNAGNSNLIEVEVDSVVTGSFDRTINNTLTVSGLDGNDTLRVDFSNGNPIPINGLIWDGGTDTLGDRLELQNLSASLVAHSFVDAATGSITIAGSTISYSAVESIGDFSDASFRSFAFGGSNDVINLSDDGIASNGVNRISSGGTSLTIDYLAPLLGLAIDGGAGNDTVTLANTEPGAFGAYSISVLGGAGNDLLTADFSQGIPLQAGLTFDGGSETSSGDDQGDVLRFVGGTTTAASHVIANSGAGNSLIGGVSVIWSELEGNRISTLDRSGSLVDELMAENRSVTLQTAGTTVLETEATTGLPPVVYGDNTPRLSFNRPSSGFSMQLADGTNTVVFPVIDWAPNQSLTGGTGNDRLLVNAGGASVPAPTITLSGGSGTDSIEFTRTGSGSLFTVGLSEISIADAAFANSPYRFFDSGFELVTLEGGSSSDRFTLTPRLGTEFDILAGDPTTAVGDELVYIGDGINTVTNAATRSGVVTLLDYKDVRYVDIETLEIRAAVNAASFVPLEPRGSQIFESPAAQNMGRIESVTDVDSFLLNLDAGQTLTALAIPNSGTATLGIQLVGSTSVIAAAGAGAPAIIQVEAIGTGAAYEVQVTGDAITNYEVLFYLNAAVEIESFDGLPTGPTNDSRATAQSLTSNFIALPGSSGSRAGLLGVTELGSSDWYQFTPNGFSTVAVDQLSSGVLSVNVLNAAGTLLASGLTAENISSVVTRLAEPGGDLFIEVLGSSLTNYSLVVTRGVTFDVENNSSFEFAQEITGTGGAVGFVENTGSATQFNTPILNFGGQGFNGVQPPDTVGDVGIDHYIQAINSPGGSLVTIYNKSDGSVALGPFVLDSRATDPNGADGLGDPIVLFDHLANRWLISEFVGSPINGLSVYISQTADPTDDLWYHYVFNTGQFPDYPHYAVWPDGYYVTANDGTQPTLVLDRENMLLGQAARPFQRFNTAALAGFGFQALTPSDLDGQAPPVGAPNYVMRHRDDEVHNVGANNATQDFLEVFEFHTDWTTPANSTFTQVSTIPISEFDSDLNGLSAFFAFPQPGTTTQLDPLREVIMNRLQYRNFGSYETLVGNFVTDVDSTDHGGVRWFELRKVGAGAWALHQEGTVAPDSDNRWMGGIAMDGQGNIALGYSISSSTTSPGLRYIGRLASDPLGTMPQGEYTLVNGIGFNGSNRWGDYAAMSVDPVDDRTFWFTSLYANSGVWATQIGAIALSAPTDHDWYEISVNAGDNLTISTAVPGVGTREFVNSLDPSLELFAPDGSSIGSDDNSLDGRNAVLSYTATSTGIYRIHVAAVGSAGEYVLNVSGATGAEVAPEVVATFPIDGGRVDAFPTTYALTFSEGILSSSVSADDLIIGGLPALGVTQVDGDTFEFTVHPAADIGDGTYSVSLAAAAIMDWQGIGNLDFAGSFIVDRTGPRITSTLWNGASFPTNATFAPGPLSFEADFDEVLKLFFRARGGLRTPSFDDIQLVNLTTGAVVAATSVNGSPARSSFSANFPALTQGEYQLRLISGDNAFEDAIGNNMDGEPLGANADKTTTGDGVAGGDYVIRFVVDANLTANGFTRLVPLGSGIALSSGNVGVLDSASDTDDVTAFLEAGQNLTAIVKPSGSESLTIELIDPSGGTVATATSASAGEIAAISMAAVLETGNYILRISGTGAVGYDAQAYKNAAVEIAIGDSANGSELAISNSLVDLGGGRFGVVGRSQATAASRQFSHYTNAARFVDISTTGTLLNIADEAFANITTTISNAIFPSGAVTINDNGTLVAGSGQYMTFSNGTLPQAAFGAILAPFWDDLDTGPVYWQQTTVGGIPALIVQWHNRPHFNVGGSGRFQLQLFATGSVLSRFAYADVDWGSATVNGGASATIGVQFNSTTAMQFSRNTATLNANSVLDLIDIPGVSDVDEYTVDLSAYVGRKIDLVLDGLAGVDFAGQSFQLLHPNGTTVLATGSTQPLQAGTTVTNYDQGILGFTVPAAGVYTIRLTSSVANAEYGIVLTESLPFDTEPNNSGSNPLRNLELGQSSLGYLGAGEEDRVTITAPNTTGFLVWTETPFDDGSTTPTNTLDATITVYDSLGSVVATDTNSFDGKNAFVRVNNGSAGPFTLAITSATGSGEYLLRTSPFHVFVDINLGTISEAAGTNAATITVSRDSGTTGALVVNLTNSDTSELSVPVTVTIPDGEVSVTVSIDAVDDLFVDGTQTVTITGSVTNYASGSDTVDVTDDEVAGFTVTPTSGLIVTEAGGTATFSVVLVDQPQSNVVLQILSADTGEVIADLATLTFTPSNWNVAQTVTAIGVNDFLDDGDIGVLLTVSINDAASHVLFGAVPDQTVGVTNEDDDTAGITIAQSSGTTSVNENGSTDTFTVALNSEPFGDVVLTVSSGDISEGIISPATLTFNSTNWNRPQTVTLAGVDDFRDDGDINYDITVAVDDVNSEVGYQSVTDEVFSVTTVDNDTIGFTISPAGTSVSESGTTTTFTLVLNTLPLSDVVLTVVNADASELAVDISTLTFTVDNWNVPQTVTVTGEDDTLADGSIVTGLTIAVDDANSDAEFALVPDQVLNLTATDNEIPNFSVTASGGSTLVDESGTQDTLDVVLTVEPTGTVVITVTASDSTEVSVSPLVLTFNPGNWNVPQTVTVTGVDEFLVDPTIVSAVIFAIDDSASYDVFDPVANQSVSVSTTNNDVAGFQVTESDGATAVSEPNTVDTVTVVLTAQPMTNVVFNVSSSDTTEATVGVSTVQFTTANWNIPQTVLIRAVNDFIIDGTQSSTIVFSVNDGTSNDAWDPLPDQQVTASVADNDVAGFTVTQTGGTTSVTEGGSTDSISVKLNAEPFTNVVINITVGDATEVASNRTQLIFTPANWNTIQTVIVNGVNDTVVDGTVSSSVTFAINAAASDDNFDLVSNQSIAVSTLDDEPVGLRVVQTGGTLVSEAGTSDTFTVSLLAEPLGDVVVNVSSGNTAEATVSTSSLRFTPVNWNVAQTVTVTGVDDVRVDGSQSAIVTLSVDDAASHDLFDNVSDQTVNVINQDNDNPGFTVTPVGGSLSVSESGTLAEVQVVLPRQPLSNVVIDVSVSDSTEASVNVTSLTFTPSNWNVSQSVFITGVDDMPVDGPQSSVLRLAINDALSNDFFDALSDVTLGVTTVDNDVAGFVIAESGGNTIVSEDGTVTDSVTIALTGQPLSNVVLAVTTSNRFEATAAPATVVFTPDNWNIAQTITISGVDDVRVDGSINSTLRVSVVDAASNGFFDVVSDQTVGVVTTDNDVAGFMIVETGGATIVSEAGFADIINLVLTAAPVGEVIFEVSSSRPSEVETSPETVVFSGSNWNVPQPVWMLGMNDLVLDGDQTATITVRIVDVASDDAWDGVADRSLTATNRDDDVGGFALEYSGDLVVSEAGTTRQVAVVLNRGPLANVVVDLASSDTGEVAVGPSFLTFTPENWNQPQFVTLTGVNDDLVDGIQSSVITASINAALSDDHFDALAALTAEAFNTDNDAPGFVVSETNNATEVNEAGGSDVISIVLTSQPGGNVTISATSGNTAMAVVGPSVVTFTPTNWNVPQTVLVSAVDDQVVEGDGSVTVTLHVVDESSVESYRDVADQSVQARVIDDDSAVVSITGGSAVEGSAITFAVALSKPVNVETVVTLSTVDDTATLADNDYVAAQSRTVIFPPLSTSQTLTIATVSDLRVEANESFKVGIEAVRATDRLVTISATSNIATGTINNDDVQAAPTNLFLDGTTLRFRDVTNRTDQLFVSSDTQTNEIVFRDTSNSLGSTIGSAVSANELRVSRTVLLSSALVIELAGGNDRVDLGGLEVGFIAVTVSGGAGNDQIRGSNGGEVLLGDEGNDIIQGEAGNDVITGAAGSDTLMGGGGNDVIKEFLNGDFTLTTSSLVIRQGATIVGTDVLQQFEAAELSGGSGNNRLDASGFVGSGTVTLNGGLGNDTLIGSPGVDSLSGGGGDDSISGGAGNDVLFGNDGRDTLNGDAGNDFLLGQAGESTMSGGDGADTLIGHVLSDSLSGDAGNDKLFGSGGNDRLAGGANDDQLNGEDGNDSLDGGAGNDALTGGTGTDTVDGGADSDRLNESANSNVTVTGTIVSYVTGSVKTLANVERINLTGGASANLMDARQSSVSVLMLGEGGNDTLLGGSRNDILQGGAGDDVLSGGAGVDAFDGGDGNDAVFERANANFTVTGTTISSTAVGTTTPVTETPINVEVYVLMGGDGNNLLDARQSTVRVALLGGRGNDTLLGSSLADTLSGGSMNDASVVGGDGVDSIDGGAGSDVIERDTGDAIVPAGEDVLLDDVFAQLGWISGL